MNESVISRSWEQRGRFGAPSLRLVASDGHDVFRREGDYWSITFTGSTVRLRDAAGLRDIARLLAAAGRELHVLQLVAVDTFQGPHAGIEPDLAAQQLHLHDPADAGPLLDAEAIAAYRQRLRELAGACDEAEALHDGDHLARLRAESTFLRDELLRAVGKGGRVRRGGSASERARVCVTRRLRRALHRITIAHPNLGEHLHRTLHTGTFCSYLPDSRLPNLWVLQ